MERFKKTIILFSLLLFACIQANSQPNPAVKQGTASSTDDKAQLQKLIRQLYKWNETANSNLDFEPLDDDKQDSLYIGLDLKLNEQRIKELRQTNFFAEQFLDNYNKIALTIDQKLKNKELEWLVGDMPPFGNGANPWTDTQDYPDNYWLTITLENIRFDNNTASFNWTWGENFKYKVRAVKENESWKITHLQGFDIDEFIPTE